MNKTKKILLTVFFAVICLFAGSLRATEYWAQSNWSGGLGAVTNGYNDNVGLAALNDGLILGQANNIVIDNSPRAVNYASYWSSKNIGDNAGDNHLSQSFTAVGTTIDEVMLGLSKSIITAMSNLTVSIRSNLTGLDLSSAVITNTKILLNNSQYPSWISVKLPLISTTIGNTYYLYLRTGNNNAVNYYKWTLKINNPYPNGQGFDSANVDAGGDYLCRVGPAQTNVANTNFGGMTSVAGGCSRNNCMIDTNKITYDGGNGYASYNYGGGRYAKTVLPAVREINQVRTLLWDGDARYYNYYIAVSEDDVTYTTVVDKQAGIIWKSWQSDVFSPIKARYIKTYGTFNSANGGWHAVEQEVFPSLKSDVGYLVSSIISNQSTNVSYGHVYLNNNGQNDIKVKVRTLRTANTNTGLSWTSCPYVTNNQLLKNIAGVTDGRRFMQYRIEMSRVGSPKFQKIKIEVDYPPSPPKSFHITSGTSLAHTNMLIWGKGSDPDPIQILTYNLKLSTNSAFIGNIWITSNIPSTNVLISSLNEAYIPPTPKPIYWKVQTQDELGRVSSYTGFSTFFLITSRPPLTPVLSYPIDNGEICSNSFNIQKDVFQWTDKDSDIGDILHFSLAISTNPSGSPFSDSVCITSNIMGIPGVTNFSINVMNISNFSSLKDDTVYYWQVKPFDDHGIEGGVPIKFKGFFNKTNNPPANPTNLAFFDILGNGLLENSDILLWSWSPKGHDIFDPVQYQLQVSDDSNFSTLIGTSFLLNTNVVASNITGCASMVNNGIYYWRVRADDTKGKFSPWIAARSNNGVMAPFKRSTAYMVKPSLPISGGTIQHGSILKWTNYNGAGTNNLMLGTNRYFLGHTTITSNLIGSSNYFYKLNDTSFPGNKILYWRFQTRRTNLYSFWSGAVVSNFFFSVPPPSKPNVIYPTNNGKLSLSASVSNSLGFKWICSEPFITLDTNDYFYCTLSVSSNSNLSSPLSINAFTNHTAGSNFHVWYTNLNNKALLKNNHYYYYSISACNSHNILTNSSTVRFFLNLTNTGPSVPSTPYVYRLDPAIPQNSLYSNSFLKWNKATNAGNPLAGIRYQLQIFTNSVPGICFFSNTLMTNQIAFTSVLFHASVMTNKLYYFRVRAIDEYQFSSAWLFATNNTPHGYHFYKQSPLPSNVSLLIPKGTALRLTNRLIWQSVSNPEDVQVYYFIQVSKTSVFSNIIASNKAEAGYDPLHPPRLNTYSEYTNLKEGCIYYWRVFPYNSDNFLKNTNNPSISYFYIAKTNLGETIQNTRCIFTYEPQALAVNDLVKFSIPSSLNSSSNFIKIRSHNSSEISGAAEADRELKKQRNIRDAGLPKYEISMWTITNTNRGSKPSGVSTFVPSSLLFGYSDSGGLVSGINESYLNIFRLDDSGGSWTIQNGKTSDSANNTVSVNVAAFGIYTLLGYQTPASLLTDVALYPSPFKPGNDRTMKIQFTLTENSKVTFSLYTLMGDLVFKQVKEFPGEGTGSRSIFEIPGKNQVGAYLANGVYLYNIEADSKTSGLKAVKSGKIGVLR